MRLVHDVDHGYLTVQVEQRRRAVVDSGVRLSPLSAVTTPPPPAELPDLIDDNRALFIKRSDAELSPDGPLTFTYLIRELPGATTLKISAEGLGGQVVHERSLGPDETQDGVHDDAWDGVATVGQLQGERLGAEHGPGLLELIHDDTYRDEARFRVAESTAFEVEVLDEVGEVVEGVEFEFLLDGEATTVASGPDGVARFDGAAVPELNRAGLRFADIEAVRELLEPRWELARDGEPPPASDDVLHVPVKPEWQGATLDRGTPRTLVLLPSSVRIRLDGMHFDTSKSFLLPGAMKGIARLREIYEDHPDAKVVVCGHTDTSGSKSYNLDLSLERAESILAYLTDDVDAWNDWFGPEHDADKRWGTVELQHMLKTLPSSDAPYYEGDVDGWYGSGTRGGVEQLQSDHGLPVTGEVDDATRRALITDYMAIDGTTLPEGVEIEPHGCGEFFPEDQTGDAVSDEDNRRVDVFFFDGAVQPPSPGPLATEGEREYPAWRERALKTHVLDGDGSELGDTMAQIHVLLRSNSGSVPLEDRPYRVDVDGTIHEGVTDGEGFARIDDVPSGDYELELEDVRSLVPTRPRGAPQVVHVVAGYYLLPPT